MYCVLCGILHDDKNGIEQCPKSECNLSHLWAQIGHVENWFPIKRDK